jgi:MoaA/NifB/PqqE/SkfB family radical SAM enzyme
LPWTGIYVDPSGKVQNCAISTTVLGNVHYTALPNIVNNQVNTSIKHDMLAGHKHSRCRACYDVEDNASDQIENASNRTWYKKIMMKNHQDFSEFENTKSFVPMVLDLRWRNTCNQACVYCGPDLSSLWADTLNLDYSIEENTLQQSKSWIFDRIKSVRHIYLAGGEPLLIKDNQLLLEELLDKNPKVEIRVNTNLSRIDTPVFKLLQQFEDVKWTVSVDSQKECFEYMRWPGNWQEFLRNLDSLRKLFGDQINFNMVWCILNDIDILDTVDFLLQEGYHENMFIVQCLTDPYPLNIHNLPAQQKKHLQTRILSRQQDCNPQWWLYKSLQSMYNFLQQPITDVKTNQLQMDSGLPGTFQYLEFIDRLHKTDSKTTFPRLYALR